MNEQMILKWKVSKQINDTVVTSEWTIFNAAWSEQENSIKKQ